MKQASKFMTSLAASGVRLAALILAALAVGTAWAAPTATVVWESDFGTAKTVDGSTFEIVPNSASLDGNGNLAIGASTGNSYTSPTLAIPAAFQSDKITVLIKYSGLAAYSSANAALSSVKAEYNGDSIVYGLRSNGSGSLNLIGYNENNANVASLGSTVSLGTGAGYYLVSTDTGVGVYGYTGTHVKGLSGSSTALKMNYNYKVTSVSLGGSHGVNKAYAWAGVTIEKVAIFIGNAYSNTDLADFVWPSSEYAKWAYANNAYTWVPSNDSSDIGSSDNGTLYQFDVASGEDTSTTLGSGGNNWKQFCIGQAQYSAPGCALRFTSSSADKTFTGGFSPFTFGGIIVESDAGGLSIGTANDGRTTVFGAASGATETWFGFDADASVIRSGAFRFSGNVNLDIANGKTLSLAAAGSPAIVASVNNNQMATTAGGTLRVHGGGKLTATLNASGAALDFSDQPTASDSTTSAYIQGALTVDEDTTFTFPTGATFPYFVATSISGDIDHNTGYKANADGSISVVEPKVLSITSAETEELPTTWTSSDDAVVNVSAGIDATLNVTAAATLSTITFYVPATSTLTISGSAITASTIYFPQPGVVKVSSAGALVGTAKGSGTLQYSGFLPTITSGISFSNSDWTGTMWLKDFGLLSNGKVNSNLTDAMPNWGNSGSKVKFTNVRAYTYNGNLTCAWTLVLEDGAGSEEYAWRCDNGYSTTSSVTFGGLAGTGTFYDGGTVTAPFKFNSYNNFTGVFDITAGGHRIGLAANCNSTGGTIAIGPDVVVNFEEGNVWTAGGGFVVNNGATLNVNTDATVKFASQGMLGTLNIAENKTLTAVSDDALGYNATGTVNVYGTLAMESSRWTLGQNNHINIYGGGTITGNSNTSNGTFDMNIKGGATIHACGSGSATLACPIQCRLAEGEGSAADGVGKIEVDEGMTLTCSGRIYGDYKVAKTGSGTLVLTYNGSDSYTFPLVQAGAVELGGSQAWNVGTLRDFAGLAGYIVGAGSSVAITQTKAEYGSGVTTVTGIDSSITSITVNKFDGTTATITPTAGAGALEETAVVSGSTICNHDYEFDNAWTDAGSDQKDAYTWDSTDQNFLQDGETSNWSVYTAVCPGNYDTFSLSGDWSAAIRCTVPQKANGVIVAFGNNSSFVALAAGATENTARLVKGGGDNVVVTELATMSVAHAATAMHVYAFVKTANAVDIYCDGNLVTRYNGAIGDLSDGFQFGSIRSGVPTGCGLVRLYNSEKATGGNVDYMRIYNFAIDANMIAKLHNDHPYVPLSTAFTRTLDGESGLEWSAADAWTKGAETAAEPDADGIVELTASADSTIAANLSEAVLYETLTFTGAGAITVTKVANAATLSAVEVAVDTDTTVAADAVDFTVSRVAVAAGNTLKFNVSGIASANGNWANAASVDRIRLTGLATLEEGAAVAVTPETAGYWNLSAVADGGYYYLSVTPGRANGEIYWQSGYWSGGSDNSASFTTDKAGTTATKYFAGDTVVVPNTTQRWMGTISDGATITYDCSGTINISKTGDLGYVLKNATVIVASGTTLNFVNQGSSAPEVYGGTISGAGKVQVASGITLTLSNGATINAATALTGAGTVNLATVPAAQMAFDNWTGTVRLPAITSGAIIFNNYGTTGSTVHLTSMSSGAWIQADNTTINPKLYLAGNMTLSTMSQKTYTFAEIDGPGALSFATSEGSQPTAINITKVAEGYSGTISSSLATPVTITTLKRASGVSRAGGTKLLSLDGTAELFDVGTVEIGGTAVTPIEVKDDGVYIGYGTTFTVY